MNEIKTKKVLTEEQKAKQKAYYESRKEILKKKRENLTDEEKRIKREKRKEYKKNKSEMFKNYSREYYEKNKDIQKEKHTEYVILNKEKIKVKKKEYREKNKEKIKEYEKNYRQNVRSKDINFKEYMKVYRSKNKENIKTHRNNYELNRRQNEPLYKLKCNISSLIRQSIKLKGYMKETRTHEILGCSYEDFKIHLEKQFTEWMTWDNYGNPVDGLIKPNKTWDIDHIIPTSSATSEEELLKLNHYTNLQPLCSYHNRYIKKDN
jgi:hypothetical protein